MSATATSNLLSVSDYLLLPEGGPRIQLIEGDFFMAPSPRKSHQNIGGTIFILLHEHVKRSRKGAVMIAPFDVYLDDNNVYQPDVPLMSPLPAKRKSCLMTASTARPTSWSKYSPPAPRDSTRTPNAASMPAPASLKCG